MPDASITRRLFLRNASSTAVGAACLSALTQARIRAQEQSAPTLTVDTKTPGHLVPAGFIGLSYENMQLEDPTFFSPANKSLIQQFRVISPKGVLRLGGNTSEFGWWKPTPQTAAPTRTDSPWKAVGEPTAATVFAITPEAIEQLNGFLQATGWTCIYGLNLGYGTPETALPEATFVFNQLGSRLEYFQVGNEVDLFKGHLRDPATWNVDRYLEQWLAIARAVGKALPGARFGMPDVAVDVTWLSQTADRWTAISDRPSVVSMSHHYYWSGPPSNPQANIENLMRRDPKVSRFAQLSSDASKKMGPQVTWRMTEGNTVYRGGKDGLSDVFAAALWAADYLLQLMSLGYAGVNLHGGSGHAQAVSVGGSFIGEEQMADPNAPHPKPFYTPIANEGTLAGSGVEGKLNSTYLLEPVGYGMKFAAAFAGATMLPAKLDTGGLNVTSYAARRPDGRILACILNKEPQRDLVILAPGAKVLSRLTAPALDSREAHILPATQAASKEITIPAHTALLLLLA